MPGFSSESKIRHSQELRTKNFSERNFDDALPDPHRHHVMLAEARRILEFVDRPRILTIGDSLGRDAVFLKRSLGGVVICSDLDVSHLADLRDKKLVDGVEAIDVENIPFDDASFDFVVIKESFHHFPRPWMGFYEAARVSRAGVVMIEPTDVQYNEVKTYPATDTYRDAYEKVGNYKYQITIREAQKTLWAMGWKQLLAKGINDPWSPDFDLQPYLEQKARLDSMGQRGKRPDNLLVLGLLREGFKDLDELQEEGYRVYSAPHNPYVNN